MTYIVYLLYSDTSNTLNSIILKITCAYINTLSQASLKAFHRYTEEVVPHTAAHHAVHNLPLTLREAKQQIQDMIKPDTSLIIETGDRYYSLPFYQLLLHTIALNHLPFYIIVSFYCSF